MSQEAIVRFLVARFSGDELLRLVHFNYGELVAELPGATASRMQVAQACVDALDRHGQLDLLFFEHLRRERGRLAPEIDKLEREWSAAAMQKRQGLAIGRTAIHDPPKPRKSSKSSRTEMAAYRWLQISDIHFGCRSRG